MNASEYKGFLSSQKTDKFKILALLKNEGDFSKIYKTYKFISKDPFVKSIVRSNSFLKSPSELRKRRAIPYSGKLIGEASWITICLEENKSIVNRFIDLKLKYENEFLLGLYEKAQETLVEIQTNCGSSIWLIENILLLTEYQKGVQENWNVVSDLCQKVEDPLSLFFIENLSKRAESKLSYARYQNVFRNQVNESIVPNHFFQYLHFKLNYNGLKNYTELAYILFVESSASLIDRYLTLKEVIQEVIINHNEKSDSILVLLKKLIEIFPNDVSFCQLLCFFSSSGLNNLEDREPVSHIINEYTKGNYQYCIDEIPAVIKENPNIIEIYEIYIKSLIETNQIYIEPNVSSNIDRILRVLYTLYTNTDNLEENLDLGLKISSTFISTSWARQFLSLINSAISSSNGNKLFNKSFVIYSQIKNPRLLYFTDRDLLPDYISNFSSNKTLIETLQTISNILTGNSQAIEAMHFVASNKKKIYSIRAQMNSQLYNAAKQNCEALIEDKSISILCREELIVNLYRCYIKLDLHEQACCFYVKQYLHNQNSTKRLNKEKLLDLLNYRGSDTLKKLIELPIFYKIATDNSYKQYVAYDDFLEGQNYTRPTQLLVDNTNFTPSTIFFLRDVCTIEIMHHSYYFEGTDDLENERLEILNRLIVVDKANEDSYVIEITDLNQKANIRKAIREVNKGRISINVQQLRNGEVNNIKEAFNRFKEIETYSKTKDIVGIDSSLTMLSELSSLNADELVTNKIVYTSDPAFISFKVIFIEIRDKFLFSKEYGLDGYLSTRIRHGTLLNHIRSVFESQNILSLKDKNNNYVDNAYWEANTPFNLVHIKDEIQKSIKNFSKTVDDYTEHLVKDLIQIRTEKHQKKPKGLFDFSITNKDLALLFAVVRDNIKDHNSFINFVFDYLQTFTERLLLEIRKQLNNDIRGGYNKILQEFASDIKNVLGTNTLPELTNSINLCGTNLQIEFKSISEWFYLSNTLSESGIDLKVLIQTAIQITNTIYPTFKLNPTINDSLAKPMVGTIHFIYICRILLDNIILHSKILAHDLIVNISTSITSDQLLQVSFSNNISSEIDKYELSNQLDFIKTKWKILSNDFENIDIEGGSGFEKIRRIIAFDLSCKKYEFDYNISTDFLEIIISIEFSNFPDYYEQY